MKSKTALAYKSTGQHVVLRAFTKDEVSETPETVNPDSFNRLVLSKNFLSFMQSIDELGIISRKGFTKKDKRILTVGEVRELDTRGELLSTSIDRLSDEVYFDSASPYKHNASALKKMSVAYDYESTEFLKSISKFKDDDFVVMELMQDWVDLRNSLSLTSRVLGHLINPPIKRAGRELSDGFNGLLEAGFSQAPLERSLFEQFGIPYSFFDKYHQQYHIMIGFNTFFAKGEPLKRMPGITSPLEFKAPLLFSVLNTDEPKWATALKTSQRINYLTAQEAKGRKQGKGDTATYLSIGDAGEDWRQLAREMVIAMMQAYMKPEIDIENIFSGNGYPDIVHTSLIEALWYQLLYPKKHELIVCQNCGNAALAAKQGMSKVWCSDSCRTHYKKHYKN